MTSVGCGTNFGTNIPSYIAFMLVFHKPRGHVSSCEDSWWFSLSSFFCSYVTISFGILFYRWEA